MKNYLFCINKIQLNLKNSKTYSIFFCIFIKKCFSSSPSKSTLYLFFLKNFLKVENPKPPTPPTTAQIPVDLDSFS